MQRKPQTSFKTTKLAIAILVSQPLTVWANPSLVIHGSLHFGDTFEGQKVQRTITLENVGTESVNIIDLGFSEDVQLEPSLPLTLVEGEKQDFQIAFTATLEPILDQRIDTAIMTKPEASVAFQSFSQYRVKSDEPLYTHRPIWQYQGSIVSGESSLLQRYSIPRTTSFANFAISPDNTSLYLTTSHQHLTRPYGFEGIKHFVFDADSGQYQLTQTLEEDFDAEFAIASDTIAISPSGRYAFIGGEALHIYNRTNNGNLSLHHIHEQIPAKQIQFIPNSAEVVIDGARYYFSEDDVELRVIDEDFPIAADQRLFFTDDGSAYQLSYDDLYTRSAPYPAKNSLVSLIRDEQGQYHAADTTELPLALSADVPAYYCSSLEIGEHYAYAVHGNGYDNELAVFKRDASGALVSSQAPIAFKQDITQPCGVRVYSGHFSNYRPMTNLESPVYNERFLMAHIGLNLYVMDAADAILRHYQHNTEGQLELRSEYTEKEIPSLRRMHKLFAISPSSTQNYLVGIGGLSESHDHSSMVDVVSTITVHADGRLSLAQNNAVTETATIPPFYGTSDLIVTPDDEQLIVLNRGTSRSRRRTSVDVREPELYERRRRSVESSITIFDLNADGFPEHRYTLSNYVAGLHSIDGASALAVSPTGEQVFVVSDISNSLVIFDRDNQGDLTFRSAIKNDELPIPAFDAPSDIRISDDGQHIYVANQGQPSLSIFNRHDTGDVTYKTALTDAAEQAIDDLGSRTQVNHRTLDISPDGNYLAIAANSGVLSIFKRDDAVASGWALLQTASKSDLQGLTNLTDVAFHPEGKSLYLANNSFYQEGVESSKQITHFRLNANQGDWEFAGGIRPGTAVGSIAFTPNARNMVLAGGSSLESNAFDAYYVAPNGDLDSHNKPLNNPVHHDDYGYAENTSKLLTMSSSGVIYSMPGSRRSIDVSRPMLPAKECGGKVTTLDGRLIAILGSDPINTLRQGHEAFVIYTLPEGVTPEINDLIIDLGYNRDFTNEDIEVTEVQQIDSTSRCGQSFRWRIKSLIGDFDNVRISLRPGLYHHPDSGMPNSRQTLDSVRLAPSLIPTVSYDKPSPIYSDETLVVTIDFHFPEESRYGVSSLPEFDATNFPWQLYDAELVSVENLDTGYALTIRPENPDAHSVMSFMLPDGSINTTGNLVNRKTANFALPLQTITVQPR